jgi:photosystem II stability/assembly factor-like uncharacterized protein
VRILVLALLAMVVSGCPLPTNVRYRCEADGTCALKDQVCGPDRYCHPPSDLEDDGGLKLDGGPCVKRDVTAECAAAECGFVFDGCEPIDCQRDCPAPQECGVDRPNRCALPRLCTAEGWCWENPLPQGYDLNAATRLDGRHAWFVGEARTILFWDGERSTLQHNPAPPTASFEDVFAFSTSEAYVVGSQGVILHFDGTRWEREQANSQPMATLRAVYAFGDGGALAGGNGGLLLSRRAALEPNIRWAVENLGTTEDVRDVFVDAEGRTLVLTRRNQLFTRGPQGWEPYERVGVLSETYAGTQWHGGLLVAGWGNNGQTMAWLAPDAGRDGGNWEGLDAGFVVLELQPGDGGLFLIGQNGQFGFYEDDGDFIRFNTNLNIPLTGISHTGHTLLAAGQNGVMATVNLDSTTPSTAVTLRSSAVVRRGQNFNAVCGTSPTALYALGMNETGGGPRWYERNESANGVEWKMREFALGGTNGLYGCFAEPDRAWFTGDDTKFINLVATQPVYSDFTGAFGGTYVSAWGARGVAGYYFVRTNSNELTFSDSGVSGDFQARPVNSPSDLRAVWGLGSDDIVTVGTSGTVSKYDGATWTNATLGADDLLSLHGVRLSDNSRRYVASGANGTVATFDSLGDVLQVIDPAAELHEAFVAPSGVAYVGGLASDGGGVLFQQNVPGGAWTEVPLATPREVNGIFGLVANSKAPLWLVGPRGMILRKD